MVKALLGLMMILSAVAFSEKGMAGVCDSSSARAIQRPLFSHHPERGSFTLKYGYSERENPDATLLIFVPGGPGQTSMTMPLALPYDFATVRTDPRGVGCNENLKLPLESLSSEELARDILAIVRDLKPKKYILHGISYGTVVATMAAALATEEHVPAPAAVILEGTMGRAYQVDEYISGYFQRWSELKQQLPADVKKALSAFPLPFGYDSKTWAAWLSSALIFQTLPTGENFAADMLKGLGKQASEGETAILQTQVKMIAGPSTPAKTRLYKEIICRELVNDIRDVKYDFDFVHGELVDTKQNFCKGLSLDHPYDSAKYQITAPIIYFSGAKDPATPSAQAHYHFENQTGPRTFVSVANGGHQALSTNLMDCSEAVWLAINDGDFNKLNSAVGTCKLSSQIQIQRR